MLLSDAEFDVYCLEHSIPDNGKAYLDRARKGPPSRNVEGNLGNARGIFPSEKTGYTEQFESGGVERCAIYCKYESDGSVFEYHSQAEEIPVEYLMPNGKKRPYGHKGDYVVIAEEGAFIDQWKPHDKLLELSQKYPDRYGIDEDGVWHFWPGEKAAEELGLKFRLLSSAELNPILFRNLQFLEDYIRKPLRTIPAGQEHIVLQIVEATPGITLLELLKRVSGQVPNDIINAMIVAGKIYVDLEVDLLPEQQYARIFLDKHIASAITALDSDQRPRPSFDVRPIIVEPGESILWSGVEWTIVNDGITEVSLLRKDGKAQEISRDLFETYVKKGIFKGLRPPESMPRNKAMEKLRKASKKDIEEALRRHKIILPRILTGRRGDSSVPRRTEREYWSAYRKAEKKYGYGFVGLLHNHSDKERTINDSERKIELTTKAIGDFKQKKKKGLKSVLCQLNNRLKAEGIKTMSLKTFKKRIKAALTKHQKKLSREGERAGYAVEDIDWSGSDIPAHGDWPFHIVHIDHTLIDLELITETGKYLGRMWLTLMIDANTRRILAVSPNFDPPSYRSIMNVMRECVRRHGRLPHTVVVDNGKEFESIYFDVLVAFFKITKILRPPTKPRFGAIIERLIGTMNTTFLYNLWGNTQATKDVRKVTKAVNPRNLAIWTPERFHPRLEQWAYETYDTVEHSTLDMSPREAFERGLALTGYRTHMLIPYDLDFIMMTFPSTTKGTAKVTRLGVKIKNFWYSCKEFRKPGVRGTDVEVTYHPYDVSIAFAYVNCAWRRCVSKYEKQFKGKSEREIKRLTDKLRLRYKGRGKNFTVSDAILARFIDECEADEKELLELRRRREAENKKLLKLSELERLLPKEVRVAEKKECSFEHNESEETIEIYEEVAA